MEALCLVSGTTTEHATTEIMYFWVFLHFCCSSCIYSEMQMLHSKCTSSPAFTLFFECKKLNQILLCRPMGHPEYLQNNEWPYNNKELCIQCLFRMLSGFSSMALFWMLTHPAPSCSSTSGPLPRQTRLGLSQSAVPVLCKVRCPIHEFWALGLAQDGTKWRGLCVVHCCNFLSSCII